MKIKHVIPKIIIAIQSVSFILYMMPYEEHAHAPIGFVRFMLFNGFNLALIFIYTIVFFAMKRQKVFIHKVPFLLFLLITVFPMIWDSFKY